MHIVPLTTATLDMGRDSFRFYSGAAICGPVGFAAAKGATRRRGLLVVPGAVLACIEAGIVFHNDIVPAVARASCCRRSTVEAVLFGLCGPDPLTHLWDEQEGRYHSHESGSEVRLALAA